MDSLPTGATQSWFIVAVVGLSPIVVFFVVDVIGWVLRRKWRKRQPYDAAIGTLKGAPFSRRGELRECDVANLAEPAPTLAFLLRRHTRNRELRYATLGDCREPDYRLWRTFWIIGLGWDRTSRGFGFIISGAAMRRSSCSPECIPRSPKNGSGIQP